MRRYETIFILHPSLSEEKIDTVIENAVAIITSDQGQIIELDRWGMKKLAYPIKKELQGFYVFCDYSGTPKAVGEMERKFRIDDAVLRYLTIKSADAISTHEIAEATQQVVAKQAETEQEAELEKTDGQADDQKTDSAETAVTEKE